MLRAIEQERGRTAVLNDEEPRHGDEAQASSLTARLSAEEMKALLAKREAMMAEGDGETDQIRVYRHIIGCIQRGSCCGSWCERVLAQVVPSSSPSLSVY